MGTAQATTGPPLRPFRAPVPWAAVGYRILSAVGKTLIGAGVVLLLFVAYQLWGTGLEQAGHQGDLTDELGAVAGEVATAGGATGAPAEDLDGVTAAFAEVDPLTAPPLAPPAEGEPVGVLEIPRIDVQQVMVEGVTKDDLKKGPGHYPGTPLPGQAGNAAVAGHRTTYGAPFHRIDELEPGDEIVASTPQGRFTYEVVAPPPDAGLDRGPGWFSVRPSQVEVLDPTEEPVITLTACHPKRSARQRIIVQARLVGTPPAAAAAPEPPPAPVPGEEVAAADDGTDDGTDEDLFAGDPEAKWPALGFGLAALGVFLLAGFVGHRWWKPWAAYLVASPAVAVLLWFSFFHLDHFLPSF